MIQIIDKKLQLISEQRVIGVQGDHNTKSLTFNIPKIYGDIDLSTYECYILIERQNEESYYILNTPNIEGNNIIVTWDISINETVTNGQIYMVIKFGQSITNCVWQTEKEYFIIKQGIETTNTTPISNMVKTATTVNLPDSEDRRYVTDVQLSDITTIPNRLLKVVVTDNNINFDTLLSGYLYTFTGTGYLNTPNGLSLTARDFLQVVGNSLYSTQLCCLNGTFYIRTLFNSIWTSWSKFIIGTNTINTSGIQNINNSDNASIDLMDTGTIISRHGQSADLFPALTINQNNLASSGKILEAKAAGTTKAYIDNSGNISGNQLKSTIITGTAPLSVMSTTVVTNLNSDKLDGQEGSYYAPINSPIFTGTPKSPSVENTTSANNSKISFSSFGTTINRNVTGDSDTTLIINQTGVGAIGKILDIQSSGTSKVWVSADGLLRQQNTYGEIYVADNTVSQSITTGITYTKITPFDTNGLSSNCTPDSTNDKITITKTGRYRVNLNISFYSNTANVEWKMALFMGGAEQNKMHFHQKNTNATDKTSASFCGFINITNANTDIDLRARHDSAGSVNLTVDYANLNIEYLGE